MIFPQKYLFALAIATAFTDCGGIGNVYTLYRNSVAGDERYNKAMRFHVATFDASEGERYNRENCEIARGLFQDQPGVKVRYWCEKGRFRK
jgi:hypothetical protein